jgi:hypothetical protein
MPSSDIHKPKKNPVITGHVTNDEVKRSNKINIKHESKITTPNYNQTSTWIKDEV